MRTELRTLFLRGALLCTLTASISCGVREHPHAQQLIDTSDDFGSNAGATVIVTQPSAAGIAAPAPLAGFGALGVAGTGTPQAGTSAVGGPGGPGSTAGRGAGGMGFGGGGAAGIGVAGAGTTGTAGSAPTSATTLAIGGTTVAKADAIAFIHFGHSNMAGRATGPTAARPYFFTETDPHAWMYHAGKPLELAKEPYTAGDEMSGMFGGPGTALLKQAAAMAPGKYFVSLGFGQSSAYCSQFLPGSLYYDSVMKAPLAIKDRVTFAAIVILLGITERHGTAKDISGFSTCINTLVTAIRTAVGRPDLPVLLNDYEAEATGSLAPTTDFAKSVIPEIRKVPSVVSNSALVPTDGLGMQDDHHFNFDGHKVYTQRVLQIMKEKGWFPWTQ